MGQFPDKIAIRQTLNLLLPEVPIGDETVEKISLYTREITRWNKRINLTGAKTPQQFVEGPLFDALTFIPIMDGRGTLVDMGSGGGLPGIPAAILVPEVQVTLVEPRAKRTSFLRHALHLLNLESEVVEARDDALGGRRWDGAVAQAVWPAREWLQRAVNTVKRGGAIHTLTSESVAELSLPEGLILEEERHVVRPSDGAPRYSARIRIYEQ